ncbi:hypothetical protein LG301_08355 [Vreelandella venusta]|uniref:hypothetical protein n=1 Tax=Vreelandella venusta TaxID=44935 RepID=UPI00384CB08A
MSLKSTSFWLTTLIGSALAAPLQAADNSLTLPGGASIGVEVVESLHLSEEQSRIADILLHPAPADSTTHELPEYCVLVANAQLSGNRIRMTTQDATCIETDEAESAIYSGAFKASAYSDDGQYGLACDSGACTLSPGDSFVLTLDESVDISAQDNPSAEINAARRETNGEGVANPTPGDRPSPSEASNAPSAPAE